MALSQKEVEEVKRTWALVNQNLRQHGINILMLMFKTYGEYKQLFKRFSSIEIDDLPKSASMKAHASSFMHGVGSLVDNLEDTDTLVTVIRDIVVRHYKRGIRTEHYTNVFALLLPYLSEQLGDELTADGKSGWTKVVDTLATVVTKEVQEVESQSAKK